MGNFLTSDNVTVRQLPADVALADATSNPSISQISDFLMGFNGTTWDRLRSFGNNSDAVTVAALGILGISGFNYGFNGTTWDRLQVDASKNLKVTLATALPAGANAIGSVTVTNTVATSPGGYAGTVLTTAVSVTTTATVLPASSLANRKTVMLQNQSNQTVFVGGSGVTTANGVAVNANDTTSIDLGAALVYGIVASGTANVIVMEIS